MINWVLMKMGKEKVSISKKIKASVKKAVSFVGDFEEIAANHAIEQGYDYVVCGHIHQAQKREITNEKGSVLYLNSGDWVESLTALEYNKGDWRIFFYDLELENILKDATQEIASNLPAELLLGFETSHIINTH